MVTPQPIRRDTPAPASDQPMKMAVGLAAIADWSTQQPFLDVMKTARPLFGHLPGRWGGFDHARLRAEGYLDADGWLLKKPPEVGAVGTVILTEMPEEAVSLAGRYVLLFDGAGVVEVAGRATRVRYGKNKVTFDYEPGPGFVDIRIQRTRVSDPVRNIRVVREDRQDMLAAGAIFNPDFIDRILPFKSVRFVDWMDINGSTQSAWQDRPQLSHATWASPGVPVEIMVDLANMLGTDPWFNMPHLADDTYVRGFAAYVHKALDPGLVAYVEYSNEVWNWQFPQALWVHEQALELWDQKDTGTQFYALRAAEMARIWSEVFGADAEARLVNVISSQTGWLGLEADILAGPLVVADGGDAPVSAFDAYAITGYFGGVLGLADRNAMVKGWLNESLEKAQAAATEKGLTGAARQAEIAATRYDYAAQQAGQELMDGSVSGNVQDTLADLRNRVFPYHAEVARQNGLELLMYEGGSHVVGLDAQINDEELTAFFIHFNYSKEMGALYTQLLKDWQAVGGRMFNAYSDIFAPTQWGSWGALRHLDDDNPRWDALVTFQ